MTQIVNMMTTTATNCSKTRMRISFCDVLGEPPRIMSVSYTHLTLPTILRV